MGRQNRVVASSVLALAIASAAIDSRVTAQNPAVSLPAIDPVTIDDLVVANRILAHEGLFDAYGHVSIRHPGNPNRYILSRSVAPTSVTAGDLVEYDFDSAPIDAQGRTSVLERFIHGEIHRASPDVNAVIHTHSPTVIPFSVSAVPLRPVYHMAAFLHVGVPVWDIRGSSDPERAALLVRNAALAKSLAGTLADKPVVLMRGHGNVVVATALRMAVRNAIYTDVNARLQATAIGLGGSINYISSEEGAAIEKSAGDLTRAWELWKRNALGR